MKDIIQKLENSSKENLNQFFTKELPQSLKQHEFNLSSCFLIWEKSKALGFIDSSEHILSYMIKISIAEKRIWMLKKLKENLGKKNQKEKSIIENSLKDLSTRDANKNLLYENIETLKVVEREIKVRSHFLRWVNAKKPALSIDELRILYLGTLIHGVSTEVANLLFKIAEKNNDSASMAKLSQNYQIHSAIKKSKKVNHTTPEVVQVAENKRIFHREEEDLQRVNLNFLDNEVIKKYLNDILFSLYCLRDYKNIYKIEELIDLSFKKNPKEYQAYYFYKLTALIDQKKYKQVQSFVANEIFNLPLTQKELLPFMYLMAEALIGLKRYEDALNFYMALQKEKQFELKALLRINEIKKN